MEREQISSCMAESALCPGRAFPGGKRSMTDLPGNEALPPSWAEQEVPDPIFPPWMAAVTDAAQKGWCRTPGWSWKGSPTPGAAQRNQCQSRSPNAAGQSGTMGDVGWDGDGKERGKGRATQGIENPHGQTVPAPSDPGVLEFSSMDIHGKI